MQNIYEMLLKHLRFHMISCNGIVEREMFDIPRLYTSACSYAVQPVRLYPILMSILLHHFKELTECISELERIEAKVNTMKKNEGLAKNEEEKLPATLDSFL
jgi:hypothetical protein